MNDEKLSAILLELSEAAGPAGDEIEVLQIAARYFREYAGEIKIDRFGNLLSVKPGETGPGDSGITLALVAHIDEIGAMVTKIEEGGFLRFTPIGGVDPRILIGQTVEVKAKRRLKGVIGAAPPHLLSLEERNETVPIDKMFIDLGLDDEAVKEQVLVGDFISLEQKPLVMENERIVTGKALDNRAGVAALIYCAAELAGFRHRADICFVASLQEEVALRGAITAAYGLSPDLAVVVDVTHGDAPGLEEKGVFKPGKGPALAVGPNLHPVLSEQLQETAKRHYLPYQVEPIPGHSGTDAWAFQVSREGIPTGLLSIPLRYMHTAVELISLDDLTAGAKLLSYFTRAVDAQLLEGLIDAG